MMSLRLKFLFFLAVGVLFIWFLYIQREIITPFIFAAIFAYVFNPLVNFLHKQVKIPRTLSVIVIYSIIIAAIVGSGVLISKRVIDESVALHSHVTQFAQSVESQINTLPEFIRPTVKDSVSTITNFNKFIFPSLYTFIPQAFSRLIAFALFLFAAFYFLKEGNSMYNRFLNWIPNRYKLETEILLKKINVVLGGYLRGIIFLVILVSFVLFVSLSVVGVKYALILAIFSGFAEIVPIIGPILATAIVASVAYISGSNHFGWDPLTTALVVVLIYFVVRQVQDYFVNPQVFGRVTKLHPLVILFAVLAGEHTAGITGLLLAVPIAGVIKVIFEYTFDFISDKEIEEKYKK
ncbi:MAG: hypothetical protein A2798_01405 [Candidatus Levybacteria bacterium RIFCSPHIGHO2_01_FULL_37_17]|nr:MAG: hypothetical protein A2798_01405 [Candidatus Levybacteria bacterium RIFCSPHIGHO2_01_FULL_37_17]OGH37105.1 MAG: hypothetical protein A2959_02265 [Candidatus Levybacteria bacterium RIFCSPLOWO2_01_FULL_38_23]